MSLDDESNAWFPRFTILTMCCLNCAVNAPLYDQEGSVEFSVHGCVENWLAGGAKKDKINIGEDI